jgi:DNA-binding response OmpR family regulator
MIATQPTTSTDSLRDRRQILLVEDEPALRHIVRRNLERRGLEVVEARTAADALEALRVEAPEVLLLDINLPDRTGWDVLRELRADGRRQPRTIVISAALVPPERLREFGVEGYLPKPFAIDALTRMVAGAPGG